jgi:hypothetical protein
MATPERIEPSQRLTRAAGAERQRLKQELEKLNSQAAALRNELVSVEASREQLSSRLTLLDELAPSADPERTLESVGRLPDDLPEPPRGFLRGAAIRDVAVRVLSARTDPTEPIHYTAWLELVRAQGYGVAGRDPFASFLTQVGRSPVVAKADEPGTYVLDLAAPERLLKRLLSLQSEVAALHRGQQTIAEIVSARDRRDELVREVARVERLLREAHEALGQASAD